MRQTIDVAPMRALVCALAAMIPSEAAAPLASLEWRRARARWLEVLAQLKMTEADARDICRRMPL